MLFATTKSDKYSKRGEGALKKQLYIEVGKKYDFCHSPV